MREVRGPTALGTDRRRLWHLTRTLALTDFKLRFFGSALGYLWQLVRPLALFGILYTIFTALALDDAPFYAQGLLLGLVLYTFFADSSRGGLGSLVQREGLLRKIEFPRLAVPLSVVLTALLNLGLNLLPVFAFLLAAGGDVRLSWVELPLLVVLLTLYATGWCLLLSALFVRYRDVDPIWEVVLFAMFYGSPIFYTYELLRDEAPEYASWFFVNPFAAIVQEARHALLGPGHASAADALGGAEYLLAPFGIGVLVLVLGARVFSRRAPRIAEEL